MKKPFKAGFIGVVGLPNAGKSTLVNRLIKERVSIVTAKPQTTRRRVLGIVNNPESQIIFIDAPGFIKTEDSGADKLNDFIEEEGKSVAENADALLLLLNIDEKEKENLDTMIEWVSSSSKPWAVLISKTDIKSKAHRVMMLREQLQAYEIPVLSVSDKKTSGSWRRDIMKICEDLLPESPEPLYDKDLYTVDSMRQITAEFIREQCFLHLHDEVPFGVAIAITKFDETKADLVKIYGEIWVEKENHRPIVVGKGGGTIKKIGTYSRPNIEKLVGRKVFLDLKVKTRRWSQSQSAMKELGYVIPKK